MPPMGIFSRNSSLFLGSNFTNGLIMRIGFNLIAEIRLTHIGSINHRLCRQQRQIMQPEQFIFCEIKSTGRIAIF